MAEGHLRFQLVRNLVLRLAAKNRSFFRLMPLVIAELLDGVLPERLHGG